jgi:hypothetical protein
MPDISHAHSLYVTADCLRATFCRVGF